MDHQCAQMDTTDLKFQALSDLGAKLTENKVA